MILSELFLHELRKFLLLLDLDGLVDRVDVSLDSDLLHMQLEDLLVAHVVVPHEDPLAELALDVGRVDQRQPGPGGSVGPRGGRPVAHVTDTLELELTLLGVRVRGVHIAGTSRSRHGRVAHSQGTYEGGRAHRQVLGFHGADHRVLVVGERITS